MVAGKAAAAFVSSRMLGLARPQGRLLFGLSLAQAAATLAAVTIGVDIGLFDTDLLNATLVVVLVTVLASSLVTRSAAREDRAGAGARASAWPRTSSCRSTVDDPAVVRLAARLAMAKGGNVLVGAVAAAPGEPLDAARARAGAAEQVASAVGAEASSVVRVDTSAGIGPGRDRRRARRDARGHRLAHERRSPPMSSSVARTLDLVALADVPVLAVLTAGDDYRRVVLALDQDDLDGRHSAERDLAVAVASVAAAGARGRVVVIAPDDAAAREVAAHLGEDAEVHRRRPVAARRRRGGRA